MRTYKAQKTAFKGLEESLAVAFAVGLSSQISALADYQEASIIVIAVLIRAGLNVLKHRFGIDLSKLAGL